MTPATPWQNTLDTLATYWPHLLACALVPIGAVTFVVLIGRWKK